MGERERASDAERLDDESAAVKTYECSDCGRRVEATHQPGECPTCGGGMVDISITRE